LLAVLGTIVCLFTAWPVIPSCVFTIYLLLCGRAIAASPKHHIDNRRGFPVVQRPLESGRTEDSTSGSIDR